jgi:hypothetical protein
VVVSALQLLYPRHPLLSWRLSESQSRPEGCEIGNKLFPLSRMELQSLVGLLYRIVIVLNITVFVDVMPSSVSAVNQASRVLGSVWSLLVKVVFRLSDSVRVRINTIVQ